jgi:hypothetical protein
VFSRGSFSSGAAGVGYVNAGLTPTSDGNPITKTSSTSAGTSATNQAAFTNLQVANVNGPYTRAQFAGSQPLLFRPVGAALYVRYAGTELNRGGDIVLVGGGDSSDLSPYSMDTSLNRDGVKRIPMDSEWHHVCFVPDQDDIEDWAAAQWSPQMVAFVNSATGGPQPFEYEFYAWYEVKGDVCRAKTASYEDRVGYDCIQAGASMYNQLDSELGLDGFIRAIHAQQMQTSGVRMVGAPAGNWAGLLAFLPALASLVGPALLDTARGALLGLTGHLLRKTTVRQPRKMVPKQAPKKAEVVTIRPLKLTPKKK